MYFLSTFLKSFKYQIKRSPEPEIHSVESPKENQQAHKTQENDDFPEVSEDGTICAWGNDAYWDEQYNNPQNITGGYSDVRPGDVVKMRRVYEQLKYESDDETDSEDEGVDSKKIKKKINEIKPQIIEYFERNPNADKFVIPYIAIGIERDGNLSLASPAENYKQYVETQQQYFTRRNNEQISDTTNNYGSEVGFYTSAIGKLNKFVEERVDEQIRNNFKGAPLKIFDIGCSRGINSGRFLVKYQPGSVNVIGQELDPHPLSIYRRPLTEEQRKCLSFILGKFPNDCALPDDSIDVVIYSHVQHYLPGDPTFALTKIFQTLKPGGHFCFQVLTPYSGPYSWRATVSEILLAHDVPWPGSFYGSWEDEGKFSCGKDANLDGMPSHGGHPMFLETVQKVFEKIGFEMQEINYSNMEYSSTESSPLTPEEHKWYIMHNSDELEDEGGKEKMDALRQKLDQYKDKRFVELLKEDRGTYLDYHSRHKKIIDRKINNAATPEEQLRGIHIAEPISPEPQLMLKSMAAVSVSARKPQSNEEHKFLNLYA
jgi:SAM-dependent methyltransferase